MPVDVPDLQRPLDRQRSQQDAVTCMKTTLIAADARPIIPAPDTQITDRASVRTQPFGNATDR